MSSQIFDNASMLTPAAGMLGQHACGRRNMSHQHWWSRKPYETLKSLQTYSANVHSKRLRECCATCAKLGVRVGEIWCNVAIPVAAKKTNTPQFPVAALCSAGFSQQLGTCHWIPITQVTQVTRHHREGNGHLRNGRCADPVQP